MENPSLNSMDNLSLRASRSSDPLSGCCSLNRTFIVEDGSEEESGQWATDEITGEQGYVDDERSCFWTWDDNHSTWNSRPFKSRQLKRRNEEDKEETFLQSGRSVSGAPEDGGKSYDWKSGDWYSSCSDDSCSHTAWMTSIRLNLDYHPTRVVLDLGCTRSVGSRSAIKRYQKHAWYHGITTEFCRCNRSFLSANSETETCLESCIVDFPKAPTCSTTVDVLETGDVPILFSLPQMRNLSVTVEPGPQGDKITCPAFGLFSSPAE